MKFTVELAHARLKIGPAYPTGTRVQTNNNYTAGDAETVGTITGRHSSKNHLVSDVLQALGFTEHEVYTIKFDGQAKETIVWPDEIELVTSGPFKFGIGATVVVDGVQCIVLQRDTEEGEPDYLCEPLDPTVKVKGQTELGAGWVYERWISLPKQTA